MDFPSLQGKHFLSESQLVPIQNLGWKSRPKIHGLLRFLQTMKFCLNLCIPNPMFNVKMLIGLMLLPLVEESLIPVQGCTLSV